MIKNSLVFLNGQKVSDHNRAPLEVTYEEISKMDRMVDGTMRKYTVAKKAKFSTSWERLPSHNDLPGADTVDEGMSSSELEDFYKSTTGPITMTLRNGQGEVETYQVFITDFSKTISKRGPVDWHDVSIQMEEV